MIWSTAVGLSWVFYTTFDRLLKKVHQYPGDPTIQAICDSVAEAAGLVDEEHQDGEHGESDGLCNLQPGTRRPGSVLPLRMETIFSLYCQSPGRDGT